MGALRRWLPLLAVAGLLTVASFAASGSGLPLDRAPLAEASQEQVRPTPNATKPPQNEEFVAAEPDEPTPLWLLLLPLAAIGLALIWIGYQMRHFLADMISAHRFRRRPVRDRPTAKPARPEEEIVAALDAGLLDLDDADIDPRRAVIACWVRLEQTASAVGLVRQAGDTSTDLVVRLLAGRSLSEGVLVGFADLFRRARYASHDVDESMRQQARAALGRLRDELSSVAA